MTDFLVRTAIPADLDSIVAIQAVTFPDFQEESAIFAERITLYPQGFFVVVVDGEVQGYVVSHPWRRADPPALNTLFGQMPEGLDTYYVHDLSLLPEIRGKGASALLVSAMKDLAMKGGFRVMMLTAVGGSSVFWRRHGFEERTVPALTEVLAGYGPEAVYMEHHMAV